MKNTSRLVLPFFFIALSVLISGCTQHKPELSYPSQFEVEVHAAPEREMDLETDRRSQILHNFLAGQLSYVHDDFQGALNYFEAASDLLPEPSPQVHALLAELYLKEQNLEKARTQIEQALTVETENTSYRLLYAGILESLNDFSGAEQQYQKLLERKELFGEAYLLLASLYGRQEKFDQGISVLKKFVKRDPKSHVGYELLGRFYELQGNYHDATSAYLMVRKLNGLSTELYTSLTRTYLRQDNAKKAKTLAKEMLQEQPNHPIAQRILGELAISQGSVEEGLQYLRHAQDALDGEVVPTGSDELRFRIALLELDRQNYKAAERELLLLIAQNAKHAEARYYLASVYAGSNRQREALELLEEIDPTSEMFTKAKTFAAFLQRQAGDFEGAAKNLREVLAKEPGNLKARSYLVLILRDNRRLSEALGFVEGGLQHAPQDESLLFQAAVILHDLGQEAASLKRMEEVLVVNPKNTDALNFIAYSLAENGQQLDRAEELIRQALEIRAQDSFYLDTLGWILFQKKNFAEAEEILSRAVELSEGDVVVFEHYGDVLVQNGKQQKAEEIYKRAQQLKKKMPGEDEKKALERIEGKLRSLRRK